MLTGSFKIFGLCLIALQIAILESKHHNVRVITGIDQKAVLLATPDLEPLVSNKFVDDLYSNITKNDETEKITNLKYKSLEDANVLTLSNGGTPRTYKLHKLASYALEAYANMMQNGKYDDSYRIPPAYCPKEDKIDCDSDMIYRTYDGTCNNLKYVWWGAAQTPLQRLAKEDYDDGVSSPRAKSVTGKKLPNPRRIAMVLHWPRKTISDFSALLPFFTQFVAHDVTLIASATYSDGSEKRCSCGSEDPDCFNIPVPAEDYHNKDQDCLVFTRSSSTLRFFDCKFSARQQINMMTAYTDMSHIYGKDERTARKIRLYQGGLLKYSRNKYYKGDHLPYRDTERGTCLGLKKTQKCYHGGDPRCEDNSYLMMFQTLWVREHNRLARKLALINPHWDDETLYQQARKIAIAEYNHVIYSELLPLLVGDRIAAKYDLLPLEKGYYKKYDDKKYPQIFNEFSAAAMRFGHTLVKHHHVRAHDNYQYFSNKTIDYYIFNQEIAEYNGGVKTLMAGALADWAYYPTNQVNHEMNHYLFDGLFPYTKRISLPAYNIQRGRDHGIASYNNYRELCGLKRAKTFSDLTNIPPYEVKALADLYESVDDIDLWSGIVSEYPEDDSVLGATGSCIIAKQFSDLKRADRHYYENGGDKDIRFTPKQLTEIRQTSLSGILCDNMDFKYLQKFPFLGPHEEYNQYVDCSDVYSLSLREWKDKRGYDKYAKDQYKPKDKYEAKDKYESQD